MEAIYTQKCSGCRSCELACSFHHKKIFSPEVASIEVRGSDKEGKCSIILYRQAKDGHMACDCARGKEFCLNYCPEVARGELEFIIAGSLSDEA